MKDGCLQPEEIAAALAAESDDPRRRHLAECAWCQALQASYELFGNTDDLPADADLTSAEKQLDSFLQREIAGRTDPATAPGQVVPLPVQPVRRNRRSLAAIWAVAAVLVVVVGLFLQRDRDGSDPRRINLRSEVISEQITLQLAVPEVQADGDILLAWTALAAASSYELLLLDGEQQEVERLVAGSDTTLLLAAGMLSLLEDRPSPWFVRVIALGDGDELARSLPRLLPESESDDPADTE